MRRATVIGAGVAGLTVATELQAAGFKVVVVDRAERQGPAQCSWWAGGMLAPWCERESAEEPVVALGVEAADWWERNGAVVERNGTLVVAPGRDRSELQRFARRTRNFETLDGAGVAAVEPALEGRFSTGLYFAEEAHLAPRQAIAALAEGIAAGGGEIRFGVEAEDAPRADVVVDCRGLAAGLADLRGVKGEMLVIRTPEIEFSRPVRLLHPRHPIYVVPRGDGVFMLGATMIESADRARLTVRSMLELLGAAYALHPAFAEAEVLEIGVDARPAFPDNLPRAFWREGRLHVNGFYRHGFLLSPALARQAAGLALAAMEEKV